MAILYYFIFEKQFFLVIVTEKQKYEYINFFNFQISGVISNVAQCYLPNKKIFIPVSFDLGYSTFCKCMGSSKYQRKVCLLLRLRRD